MRAASYESTEPMRTSTCARVTGQLENTEGGGGAYVGIEGESEAGEEDHADHGKDTAAARFGRGGREGVSQDGAGEGIERGSVYRGACRPLVGVLGTWRAGKGGDGRSPRGVGRAGSLPLRPQPIFFLLIQHIDSERWHCCSCVSHSSSSDQGLVPLEILPQTPQTPQTQTTRRRRRSALVALD